MSTPPESTGAVSHWHVRVDARTPQLDGRGRDILADVRQIGLEHIEGVRTSRIYLLAGSLEESHVRLLAEELLADPVAERAKVGRGFCDRHDKHPAIEVHRLPGVMDPPAMSALDAGRRLLAARVEPDAAALRKVQTARRYEILGARSAADLEAIASQVLANDCIETWYIDGFDRHDQIPDSFATPPESVFTGPRQVAIRELDDEALQKLSREGHLFLSLEEMQTIRDHFNKLDRDPTDLEVETLAQTWSEHCVHKTLKSAYVYRGDDFGRPGEVEVRFDNLLKETIVGATTQLNRDWCLSVFVDNAGIIAFDDEYGLAFKVETHNHPSAIEPYGGAATGIGGCIRDIMGCGLGAKPIASTDVFCLAPPDFEADRVPAGVLHPRRVLKGVVGGVRDYGNRMGIPTVNGAIYFDDRYLGNPLVFCGCVGLIPRKFINKQPQTGDRIVVAGGRTGRDGIHGATFSSAELTDTHADEFSHAVQIGHAIEEKKVLDALLIARDHPDGCLFSAVTDCGAGGLSSAVGEMAEELGAVVDLENVPLKYSGLRYHEIWISEAQERMVFAVPPDQLDAFLKVFAEEEVEATVIGEFSGDGVLRVRYADVLVGELNMRFLHKGLPSTALRASWRAPAAPKTSHEPEGGAKDVLSNERLLGELSQLNVASKEWVIRQYDHEVQGRSVVKPLVGPKVGPSDAAVVRPRYDKPGGVAIGCGLCPELSEVDPYLMAIAAVDEALRNVVCVGANPQRTAILDNFCWPKVDSENSLGALVRTCRGAHDAAMAFGLPFISGKDSLNNEFSMSAEEARRVGMAEQIAIPYTLLISAMGIVNDVAQCVTMDLKKPGNCLVIASSPAIPLTWNQFFRAATVRKRADVAKQALPDPDVHRDGSVQGYEANIAEIHDDVSARLCAAFDLHQRVSVLIRAGKVLAAHDVSDGGLAVSVAEMCIASGLGVALAVSPETYPQPLCDSLTTTYVLEMAEEDAMGSGWPIIGRIVQEPQMHLDGGDRGSVDISVDELARAWRTPLAQGGSEPRNAHQEESRRVGTAHQRRANRE